MEGSVLIYGGSLKAREEKASDILKNKQIRIPGPDYDRIEVIEGKKSLGIEQVREAISFLNKKPFESKQKALVISEAEKLTIDAQNALLKILEEPPSYALIILMAKTHDSLLPTVISRCRKFSVIGRGGGGESENSRITLKKILKMTQGERLSQANDLSKEEKDDILQTLEYWISEARAEMTSGKNKKNNAHNISNILDVKNDLEDTNINTKLALEYLMLLLK
jgi:DNA polymerase III delta prime subunit